MGARVMVMAGGTGGHVYPALAVAEELRARGMDVLWLGTPDSFESRTVPRYGIRMETINISGLRGKGVSRWLSMPFRLAVAMGQAAAVLRRNRPALALGMGGFASGPGGLVAWLMGVPLVVQEQNAVAGMTNRWLARVATRVAEAFPGSFGRRKGVVLTGNPLRGEIAALAVDSREETGGARMRLLILGGSLGAAALNEALPAAVARMDASLRPEIRHQTGRGRDEATRAAYAHAGVEAEVSPFVEEMAAAYRWADLVVCRAGALTVSELASAGVGAILVPYPHAVDDHQTLNAGYLVEGGAALLIQQSVLTPERLAGELEELASHPDKRRKMAAAARVLGRPDATARVADLCEEVIVHG